MPSINFNLDDVKPLLSSLGLGQAPNSSAPPVDQMNIPPMMPPVPPPPTPAVAGFKEWASDPANQQKVANGITLPGQPLLPTNVPPASPMSPSAPTQLGSGVPLDPSAGRINLTPPQRDMSWLTPPCWQHCRGEYGCVSCVPKLTGRCIRPLS
jgi:hypothetical protein